MIPTLERTPTAASESLVTGYAMRTDEGLIERSLFRPLFRPQAEAFVLAGFDRWNRLICLTETSDRTRRRSAVPPAIVRTMLGHRTLARVWAAHNHPSGCPEPSVSDVELTRKLGAHLQFLGVDLFDHQIYTDAGHFSFRRAGLL